MIHSSKFALAMALFLSCAGSQAATFNWTGASSTDFNSKDNWLVGAAIPGVPPSTTDDVVFSGPVTANQPKLTASVAIRSVLLSTDTGGWILDCDTFTLTLNNAAGLSTLGQTSGTNTITGTAAASVTLTANQTWIIGSGGRLDLNGVLAGSSTLTINTTGNTGTLAYLKNNTHSGVATLAFGTLLVGDGTAAGSFVSVSISAGANLIINRSDDAILSGAIAGPGTFTHAGASKLTLTNSNTFSGTTIISSGSTLQLGNAGTSGSVSGPITNNGALIYSRSGSPTFSQTITGAGDVTITGGGVISFNGGSSYTGLTTVKSGTTVTMSNLNSFGANSAGTIVEDGATVRMASSAGSNDPLNIKGSGVGANNGAIYSNTSNPFLNQPVTMAGDATARNDNSGQTLFFNGTPALTGKGVMTVAGSGQTQFGLISEPSNAEPIGLTIKSTNTTVLTSTANTYSGPTVINAGTLQAANVAIGGIASSIGMSTSDAANLVLAGGVLQVVNASTSERLFTLGDANGLTGGITSSNNTLNFNNPNSLAYGGSGPRTFTLGGSNTGSNSFWPLLENGPGGKTTLNKTGNGSWTLNQISPNAFTGGTNVIAGTLTVGVNTTLGSNIAGNDILVSNGAKLIFLSASNFGSNQKLLFDYGNTLTNNIAANVPTAAATNASAPIFVFGYNSALPALGAASMAGVVSLNVNYSQELDQSTLSNSYLGANTAVNYSAANLAPGSDNTYRLGAGSALTFTSTGAVLSGSGTKLLVGDSLYNGQAVSNVSGTVNLRGAQTYTGLTQINPNSTLTLAGGAGSITGTSAITVLSGTLALDNTVSSSSADNNTNRLGDTTPVTLERGTLTLNNNAGANSSETLGDLTFVKTGVVSLVGGQTNRITTLTASKLVRSGLATGMVRGSALGINNALTQHSKLVLGSTSGLNAIGATTAATSIGNSSATDLAIIPWLLSDTSSSGNGTNFATYDVGVDSTPGTADDVGLRPLSAGEVQTFATALNSNSNIKEIALTLTPTGTTINSLLLAPTAAATITGSGTLNITSGAIAHVANFTDFISGFDAINLGSEGILHSTQNTLLIASPINPGLNVGLTKAGGSTVSLGNANTFTGPITVNSGTLNLGFSFGSPTAVNYPYSGTQSEIVINGGTVATTTTLSATGAWGGLDSHIRVNSSGVLSVSGVFPNSASNPYGGGNIYLNEGGTLSLLTGSSTQFYFKNRVIVSGNAYIAHNTAGGSGNKSLIGAVTMNAGSMLTVQRINSATNGFGMGQVTLTGDVTFNTITSNGGDSFMTSVSSITGTGGFTKIGAGDMWLGSPRFDNVNNGTTNVAVSSTYSGDTRIEQGALKIHVLNTLPANTVVSVNSGARLELAAGGYENDESSFFDQSFAGLNDGSVGGGTVTANTTSTSRGAKTLTLNGNGSYAFSGVIRNNTGSGAATINLAKTGAGTQTLTGANLYTGPTTISSGTLNVDTRGSITSSVTIAGSLENDATLRGRGTITGNVTAGNGAPGRLWPGVSSGGGFSSDEVLDVSGNVTLTNFGKLAVILSKTGGSHVQRLNVTGPASTVNLGGVSRLSIAIDGGDFGMNDFVIVQTANPAGIPMSFNSVVTLPGNINVVYLTSTNAIVTPRNDGSMILVDGSDAPTPANRIVLRTTGDVSPVKLTDFLAQVDGAGVNISWTAVSEFQNAGFNLHRRVLGSTEWTPVNATLIPGRITAADELKYTFYDWAPAGVFEYRLDSIDLRGTAESHSALSALVSLDWNSAIAPVDPVSALTPALASLQMAATSQRVQSAQHLFTRVSHPASNEAAAAPAIATLREIVPSTVSAAVAQNSHTIAPFAGLRWFSSASASTASTASSTAAKVTYKEAGVLLIPQAAMPAGYDLQHVSIQREGRSINALATMPGGLLVYAPGFNSEYTNKDALFLRRIAGATAANKVAPVSGLFESALPVNVTSKATVTEAYHDVYFDYNLRPYSFEPWFSNRYLTQGSAQDFTLNLPHASSAPATLNARVWSLTSNDTVPVDHALQVLINGQPAGSAQWTGGSKMLELSFTVPPGSLKTGDNSITLVTPNIPGVPTQIAFLHSLSMDYTRMLDGSKPFEVTHTGSSAQIFELYNVPATGAYVVDARFSDRASLVATETQPQADGTLRLRFLAASGGSGKFLITPLGHENAPLSIVARQIKPLRLNGTYLATGPSQFAAGIQPLLMKRSREGVRGAFIDQEQLFDYYNHGRFGPEAIRTAVRAVKPAYLLLVGRTTYDYLNRSGLSVDTLCPAFLVSTNFWAQTTSDSQFGDLGRGYPEIAIGRLPVNNATELAGAVSHITRYAGIPASGARLHAAADKPDANAGNFGAQLDSAVRANHPDLTWQENYLGQTHATPEAVTAALRDAANGGADILLYSGHGNAARLGNVSPSILDQSSVQQWTGNTVFLQATCTANWMAKNETGYKSIAIQALTQPQGGISASIGTSTYMTADVAAKFMNQLLKHTTRTRTTWGQALLQTQQWAGRQGASSFYGDLMRSEQLFGDPAMPVHPNQQGTTVITSGPAGTF